MRVISKAFGAAFALLLCLGLANTVWAADYAVPAGKNIEITLLEGDGEISGDVTVTGAKAGSFSSSEPGGISGDGSFRLTQAGEKTVSVKIPVATDTAAGSQFTVAFRYEKYAVDGALIERRNIVRVVEVTPSVDGSSEVKVTSVVGDPAQEAAAALNVKIDEAESLYGSLLPIQQEHLAEVVAAARHAIETGDTQGVDAALSALTELTENLSTVNYQQLGDALALAYSLGDNNLENSRWLTMHDVLNTAQAALRSGDQKAVDAATEQLSVLTARLLESGGAEQCNIKSHDLWPVLFGISLVLNIVCIVGLTNLLKKKALKENDSTPLVDYDIFDDE